MGLDDDLELRPIEQDEEFFHKDFIDMLMQIPEDERENGTCYYKEIKRLPDIEYEAKCDACDGFPVKEGCVYYTTKSHIESLKERME